MGKKSNELAKRGELFLSMKGITKRFEGVLANDHIDFDIKMGEVHALLGENGAGKTTLMKILYGLYQPDEGEIYISGRRVKINSPKDAISLGIGMIHQHTMLIPKLTVAENVILGDKFQKDYLLNLGEVSNKITKLSKTYGFEIDPHAKVWQLSAGEKKRVEIIKALYLGSRVLILDEPTSILTPQDVKELMEVIRRMKKEGLAIIPFITHKLPEVMEISDRITVLRRGQVVARINTRNANKWTLAKKMVGKEVVFEIKRSKVKKGKTALEIKNLSALNDKGLPALKNVTFSISEGEILGIAGVAGNGQRELSEAIVGLRKATAGDVIINNKKLTNQTPSNIILNQVAYIPEDRLYQGVVRDLSVSENMILESYCNPDSPFAHKWIMPFDRKWFPKKQKIDEYSKKLIQEFDIKTPSKDTPVCNLSGGNIQKSILARKLATNPKILVACEPTSGLDIGATKFIHRKLIEQKEKGSAILLISGDLEEIMNVSDRILVMYKGEVMGILPRKTAKIGKIGAMMAGLEKVRK